MGDGMTFGRWWRWHFLCCSGGSSDVLFGVKIFGNKHFDAPWFRNTVYPAYRIARRVHDAKLWVLYRTTRRDCWTVPTNLSPGYYDCDTLMLHGCMGLLCRYVEIESGGDTGLEKFTNELLEPGSEGHGPRELVESQAERQSEAIQIYRWWKVQKPKDEGRRESLLMHLYGNRPLVTKPVMDGKLHEIVPPERDESDEVLHVEFRALEDKIDNDEQEMLRRLITIRRSLWT